MQNCLMPAFWPLAISVLAGGPASARQGSTAARHAPINGRALIPLSIVSLRPASFAPALLITFYYLRLAAASRVPRNATLLADFSASSAAPYLSYPVRRLVRGSGQSGRRRTARIRDRHGRVLDARRLGGQRCEPDRDSALPSRRQRRRTRRMSRGDRAAVRHRPQDGELAGVGATERTFHDAGQIRGAGVGEREDLARARGSGASTRCRGR